MSLAFWKIIFGFAALWLTLTFICIKPLYQSDEQNEIVLASLEQGGLQLQRRETIHEMNIRNKYEVIEALDERLQTLENSMAIWDTNRGKTSMEFEESRRRIERDIQEMWYFVKSEFKKLSRDSAITHVSEALAVVLADIKDRKITVMANILKLKKLDGRDQWRSQIAEKMSQTIQKRLHFLQNPENCSLARKLVCNLNKVCGYGCQIHHVVYCFIVAYGTGRTLILRSQRWSYSSEGYESVFLPLSNTCTDDKGHSRMTWPGRRDTQVLYLPIIDYLTPKPSFLPLAIPKQYSNRIIRFHGNPIAWWIAQFLKYLLRPQAYIKSLLQSVEHKIDFSLPIVGVHVRRTDKIGTEAEFHGIDEYMEHVEEYYEQMEKTSYVQSRRIYLATDDPEVLNESRKKFPNYIFYGGRNIAQSASLSNRYTMQSLKGVILDTHMLSKCDYIVCTFSSHLCRLSYEMMQNLRPDASAAFQSLDDIYYFGGQNDHNHIALYNHTPRTNDELDMMKGDIIGVAGNHWNGYSRGFNRRTEKSGLYPLYKTEEKIDIVNFPEPL